MPKKFAAEVIGAGPDPRWILAGATPEESAAVRPTAGDKGAGASSTGSSRRPTTPTVSGPGGSSVRGAGVSALDEPLR